MLSPRAWKKLLRDSPPPSTSKPLLPTDPNNAPVFDFSKTPLAKDYPARDFYVKVLEKVFTPEECRALIRYAETGVFDTVNEAVDSKENGEDPWQEAAVNIGMQAHQQIMNKNSRNSGRIMRSDKNVAEWIYDKLKPYIKEVVELGPGSRWEIVVGNPGTNKNVWKLDGLNDERIVFLKYDPGQFFNPHHDGPIVHSDGRQSKITMQIYLSGASEGEEKIVGGSTRIWSYDRKRYVDIEPRIGRVLLYQQKGVLHSGEEVKKGVKYALRSELLYETSQDGGAEGNLVVLFP